MSHLVTGSHAMRRDPVEPDRRSGFRTGNPSDHATRARALFPTIQITLVSIIVALALQQLLDLLPTIDALWEPTVVAARLWCQALVGFVIIVKMWTGFVLAAVVSERVPRAIDLIGPIGILIFVDAQIANIGVEHALRWWYVMGAGSLVAAIYIESQSVSDSRSRRNDKSAITAESDAITRPFAARHPAAAEVAAGVSALGIAVLHQSAQLGERGLLLVSAIYFVGQLVTAAGPIVGWRLLRKLEEMR